MFVSSGNNGQWYLLASEITLGDASVLASVLSREREGRSEWRDRKEASQGGRQLSSHIHRQSDIQIHTDTYIYRCKHTDMTSRQADK